jgi:hypothetical protein
VRLLFSSACNQARRVISQINVSQALENRIGASAEIIFLKDGIKDNMHKTIGKAKK